MLKLRDGSFELTGNAPDSESAALIDELKEIIKSRLDNLKKIEIVRPVVKKIRGGPMQ